MNAEVRWQEKLGRVRKVKLNLRIERSKKKWVIEKIYSKIIIWMGW